MSESSLATEVCSLLGYNASATLLERAERRTTSQDLATPTESGSARSFPELEVVFDSGKFRETRARG